VKNLKIIYEDEGLMAVDKPAGLLVYLPENHKEEKTLVSLLSDKTSFESDGERNGIVHRLDRGTSGLILVAKNKKSEFNLKKIFKERKVEKIYKALVWGKVEPNEGKINIPLGRGSKDRLRVVPKEGGRESITEYKVEEYFPQKNMTLLSVNLKTGRTHQVRVHFSAIGHPVVGDKKYSKRSTEINRQFLHAEKLRFVNPFNNEELKLTSNLSDDLSEFLASLS